MHGQSETSLALIPHPTPGKVLLGIRSIPMGPETLGTLSSEGLTEI